MDRASCQGSALRGMLKEDEDMTADHDKLPERIRKVRIQLGLSQEELARELGVSFATVNRWENGKTIPSKLARKQFESFCQDMIEKGKL